MPIPNNNWTNLFKEGNIFKEGFKNGVTPLDDYNLNQVLNGIILNKDSIESINKAAFGNEPIPSSGDSLQTQIDANKKRLDELDTTNVIEIDGGGVPTKNLNTWNGEYGDDWGNI